MGTGEAAALIAAALWAFSSLLYMKINVSAWGLNFSKIVIATVLIFLQLLFVSQYYGVPLFRATADSWSWLALSGLIGLVIGDTCYFRSLQILGAGRCLVIQTSAPVFTAILSWVFLGETLVWHSCLGILLTVAGIAIVVADKAATDEPGLFPGSLMAGVNFGIGAAVCQAIGAVLSRHALKECQPLEATFVRLSMAAICASAIVVWKGQLVTTVKQVARPEILKRFVPAILCGTWIGLWFSQIAFSRTNAAAAQTLLSTSPLFVIPMVWIWFGTRATREVLIGSVIAVAGIFLIFQ